MPHRALPPLDLLLPFEAAARLGSFTRAAEELAVTQSAVSQRIRRLEQRMGVVLFARGHRTIALTVEGRELLNGVTVALNRLLSAAQSLRRGDEARRVRLATDTSIAALWLMPRLVAFRRAWPDLAVDLTVSDAAPDVLEAEVAILHGDGDWPGFAVTPLFGDEIFPVCAPDYLARRPLRRVDDLRDAELLDLDYLHWNWMNWSIWLTERGVDPSPTRRVFQSNSYVAVIDAARAGLGVALGWRHFVEADLASGALVRPLGEQVTTAYGYHLLLRDGADTHAQALARHLVES